MTEETDGRIAQGLKLLPLKLENKIIEEKAEPWPLFTAKAALLKRIDPQPFHDEAKVNFHPEDGISYIVVDPAHVALREIEIPPQEGVLEVHREASYGIEFDAFSKSLKRIRWNEMMEFYTQASSHSTGRLGVKWKWFDRKYKLLDIRGMSEPKMPKLDLPVEFNIETKTWLEILRAVKDEKSNHIKIIADENSVLIQVPSDIDEGMNITLNSDTDFTYNRWSVNPCSTILSTDYISKLSNMIKEKDFNFEMGQDYPVRITSFPFNGKDTFMLAPRIESE